MIKLSNTILTRGHATTHYRSGVTPFSAGFILRITEETIPPTPTADTGGRSPGSGKRKREEKRRKQITISLYINKEVYKETKIIDEDINISANDVLIE